MIRKAKTSDLSWIKKFVDSFSEVYEAAPYVLPLLIKDLKDKQSKIDFKEPEVQIIQRAINDLTRILESEGDIK